MPGILSIPASVSKEAPCAREGAWGCLVKEMSALYIHFARDEDGALGRAAVDNAHYRWQRGIGLQVERAFESTCRALMYEA